jgi:hypothetical protein
VDFVNVAVASAGRAALVGLSAAVALACGGTVEPSPLGNTHGSAHALAQAVLRGFERRDAQALGALALTEVEFREHIWPELPSSRPERNLPFSYVWADLRQKSEASLAESLARHGGRGLALVRVEYAGETTRYASFVVHRDGLEQGLRLYGSTLEKDGVFKVFSFVVDD